MHHGPALGCGSERQYRRQRQDHQVTVEMPAHGRGNRLSSFLLRDHWGVMVFRRGRESVHGVLSFSPATAASSLCRIYLVPRFIHQNIQESGSTVLLDATKTFAANPALSAGNVLRPPLWHRERRQEALLDRSGRIKAGME